MKGGHFDDSLLPGICSGVFALFGLIFMALAALMLCFEGGGGRKAAVPPAAGEDAFEGELNIGDSF